MPLHLEHRLYPFTANVCINNSSTPNPADNPADNSNHKEHQYLNLIHTRLASGEYRPDRTVDDSIPVLPLPTSKSVFFRAVVAKLLWFISGCISSLPLSDQGVKIWGGSSSREFLDKVGLGHRDVGDLGPVYRFQWRHFGAENVDTKTDYKGQGVNRLAEILYKLKHNPFDYRIIMTLPPCDMFAQFYVSYPNGQDQKGHLHCQPYQRSCDVALGVPFNIVSYSLLRYILIQWTYIPLLQEQLVRGLTEFPELKIRRDN
ncbi:thymidylate synthase/dCMP hydroxymethylase domain-containing protein [Aspergillus caelatus]|uniref:thymidylate synthase n=1 Tax=Aspergillus caelatus TaxID=61420 RepID=A0A5N6ZLM5_9EURO|nr:thymidylate synthase/dCMP hydroxymethylase domain-containing protein [Aspergillus caelatus]KAE8357876.1 thymidylate synthase/dCMP hydroxymethylase domain-containing protein [Aspergillus caelatus]